MENGWMDRYKIETGVKKIGRFIAVSAENTNMLKHAH